MTSFRALVLPELERRRLPGLGHYNVSRDSWTNAYREARVRRTVGADPDASSDGIKRKAQLIVYFDRERPDPLACSLSARALAADVISSVLGS